MKTFLVLILVTTFSQGAWANFDIQGSEYFIEMMTETVEYLKDKSPEDYAYVNGLTKTIFEDERSGADIVGERIQINLTSCLDLDWCAAVLVHEAVHLEQDNDGRYQQQTSYQSELEANIVMLEFLRKINGPQFMLNYLQNLIKSGKDHSDLNGDGKYDEEDYLLRDY